MNKLFFVVKVFSWFSLALGCVLLSLNVFGLFKTLRNQYIYENNDFRFENSIVLTEGEFYKRLREARNLPKKEYVKTVNSIVDLGMAHYWNDDNEKKYNLTIPVWENYILYFKSILYPEIYRKYEFCGSKKAIERGVGLCSQMSIVLADILNGQGIRSNLVGLFGHVVVTVLVDENNDEWWILDPDYGVVLEHDLSFLEKNVNVIEDNYKKSLFKFKLINTEEIEAMLKIISDIYVSKENNSIINNGVNGYCGEGYCKDERLDYVLKWLIPFSLIGLYLAITLAQKLGLKKLLIYIFNV